MKYAQGVAVSLTTLFGGMKTESGLRARAYSLHVTLMCQSIQIIARQKVCVYVCTYAYLRTVKKINNRRHRIQLRGFFVTYDVCKCFNFPACVEVSDSNKIVLRRPEAAFPSFENLRIAPHPRRVIKQNHV